MTQIYPEAALATSVYLQWAKIPVAEQGGGLNIYKISYWVNGQGRGINKTDVSIGRPKPDTDGYISYEIQDLQTGLEYRVAVYGENQYSTDAINWSFYSTEISVIPSAECK